MKWKFFCRQVVVWKIIGERENFFFLRECLSSVVSLPTDISHDQASIFFSYAYLPSSEWMERIVAMVASSRHRLLVTTVHHPPMIRYMYERGREQKRTCCEIEMMFIKKD